ncbi:ATP-binding protein [Candidatus Symbiobacter mobilis]|uniref:Virulence sensor protein BvgS n=1 Tax=Candidatus Symbiobacter mobilis CR TaxID=946483 RepID=U5NEF7_9BURK|nr:ATP-binding protein [Candidatus Symbiobacter mobilis]AGX88529.1 signal transduction histidine kinase [Candidatus Symbiobacter mobilis CR]
MSLRVKVLVILAVACLVGDAVLVLLWHPWQVQRLLEREHRAMQDHLVTLGDALSPFLQQNQIGAIHEVLDAILERQSEWKSLVLTDGSGLILYPLDPPSLGSVGHLDRLQHSITQHNTLLGRIDLVTDFSVILQAETRKTWISASIITAGFLLIAIAVAVFLDVLLGRRARQLVTAAQRMSEGDFGADLPTASRDEIGQLARAFADMRAAIAAKEHALVESQQAAEASSQAKSIFLATMSHEIRTPMNGILGMAQLLLRPHLSDNERLEFARIILHSGQSLLTLLNDILDLSKVEAGRIELLHESFAPQPLLDEVKTLFREMAHEQGLDIEAHWDGPANATYLADARRVRQMIANLVSNAIKFSERGTIRLAASEVQRNENEAVLQFSVSDCGIGIPEDKLPQLFQPFSQLDGSHTRKYAGTGLGLSIIRSLATMMGGEVGVESVVGTGSTFWFRVRATAEKAQEAQRTSHASNLHAATDGSASASILQGKRLLVVEDNAINAMVVRMLLEQQGAEIVCVDNGQVALDTLASAPRFDAVLMDCQMPVMDGFTATVKLREWEAATTQPRMPVIALTAGAFDNDRKACLAAGMDEYLAKPLKLDELISVLRQWLHP